MTQDDLNALSTAEKRALLLRLLKQAPSRPARLPLSHNQQSLLALYRRAPQSAAYNTAFRIEIHGPLDVDALSRSLDVILERHAVLRATYHVDGEGAWQTIHPAVHCELSVQDVPDCTPADLEERLVHVVASDPFDLERGPVLRAKLFSQSAEQHLMLVAVHHIAFDYWSSGVFLNELSTIYDDLSAGRPPSLAPLGAQYSDFVEWQSDLLRGERAESLWKYWQERLGGELPVLNLPTDRPRSQAQTFAGGDYRFPVGREVVRRLEQIARGADSTLYTVALTTFVVMLHRYTAQDDLIVGSPSAGRSSQHFEDLIGYFVNPVALRFDCSGNPPFRAFLAAAAESVLGAIEHADFPFPLLVDRLGIPRDQGRSPVFDVIFSWDKTHQRSGDWQSIPRFVMTEARQLGGAQDLTVVVFEQAGDLTVSFQYNTDLFSAATIERMSGHYSTLLASVAENPAARIGDLDLLTVAERAQILHAWNATATPYPSTARIHELFEAQAYKSPDAVAVTFADRRVTYRELNARANQLARHLVRLGVEPGSMVGVCLERSEELIVTLIAILKAGGAYVPFDSSYPRQRLAFMLEDTASSVLVTDSAHADWLPPVQGTVVLLDREHPMIAAESAADLAVPGSSENLAYVLYTSGSTGVPKGVCVPHRAVVRLVRNTGFMTFDSADVYLQFAPVSFDASTLEIWGSLLNGARLVVFPTGAPSLDDFGAFVREHSITTLWMTAGFFHLMVDHRVEDFRGVRQLLAGGDILSVSHVRRAKAALPACHLINGYGPTENTTFTCCYTIPDGPHEGSIPIGRPIANTTVYVLDANRQPVPAGIPGELYTGGAGLALGYLNRPDLTAAQFVRDPFDNRPGAVLYRTGDLVRYRPDGNIEFLGRIDSQVKIRGFRVEPGEIEAVLKQHPEVEDAVVVVCDSDQNKRLIGYVVGKDGTNSDPGEIQRFAKTRLPGHMIPAAIVTMAAFPLSPNGKVDRRALPDPGDASPSRTAAVAPTTEVEVLIAGVWNEVLKLRSVSADDNFFDVGGNSLLLMQTHVRLEQTLGREIPVVELFRSPTVASLAAALSNGGARTVDDGDERRQRARLRQSILSGRLETNKKRRRINA
jgi:amino acid adenylation domain-containing protein